MSESPSIETRAVQMSRDPRAPRATATTAALGGRAPHLLGAAAALALAGAALGPTTLRLPLLAAAAGAATIALSRRRAGSAPPPRLQLVARVALGSKAHAALLSIDGASWLVVVGDGCAQLARTGLEEPR